MYTIIVYSQKTMFADLLVKEKKEYYKQLLRHIFKPQNLLALMR